VGIVSESDLIGEERRRVETPRPALFGVVATLDDVDEIAREEEEEQTAAGVMTRDVITLPATTGLHEAAAQMVRRRIKRIPIVRDGRLAGIITRADLLRAMGTDWR